MNIAQIVIVSLVFTIFFYLIFPIVYVKAYGRVNEEKAKKLALLNSIVWGFIFIIIGIATDMYPTIGVASTTPFTYYFVAKAILIDRSKTNDDATEEVDDNTQGEFQEDKPKELQEKPKELQEKVSEKLPNVKQNEVKREVIHNDAKIEDKNAKSLKNKPLKREATEPQEKKSVVKRSRPIEKQAHVVKEGNVKNLFKIYLTNKESQRPEKYRNLYIVDEYIESIERVIRWENYNGWADVINNINRLCVEYSSYGSKAKFGAIFNDSIIKALIKFKDFLQGEW